MEADNSIVRLGIEMDLIKKSEPKIRTQNRTPKSEPKIETENQNQKSEPIIGTENWNQKSEPDRQKKLKRNKKKKGE